MSHKSKKNIIFTIEMLPNLILHVLASANIGYDKEYGKEFRDTLKYDEIEFLEQYGKDFAFHAHNGKLVIPCFILPCYFQANTIEDVTNIYDAITQALKEHSIQPLRSKYPEEIENLEKWIGYDEYNLKIANAPGELISIVKKFEEILLACYQRFYADFWEDKKSEIEEVKIQLENFFRGKSIIELWEQLTGLDFAFGYFNVLLCEGNKECDGISLGYERDIFYFKRDTEMLIDFIIHEIGTHILSPLYHSDRIRILADENPNLFMKLVEIVAESLRMEILVKMGVQKRREIVRAVHGEKELAVVMKFFQALKGKGVEEVFYKSLEYLNKEK